ncbi:hypothetical protein EV356DRAFT_370627 [Viridothelium virens]|uniref:Uncharacterized protein n=1 Tax=Viridothelium virens TaxID=1048519 RepID=A0A6A6GW12_VIRVR|nr:hypothetical protein EV356DRAFT_370627 [Viridothelium virens]
MKKNLRQRMMPIQGGITIRKKFAGPIRTNCKDLLAIDQGSEDANPGSLIFSPPLSGHLLTRKGLLGISPGLWTVGIHITTSRPSAGGGKGLLVLDPDRWIIKFPVFLQTSSRRVQKGLLGRDPGLWIMVFPTLFQEQFLRTIVQENFRAAAGSHKGMRATCPGPPAGAWQAPGCGHDKRCPSKFRTIGTHANDVE